MTITVMYSCPDCGLHRRKVPVPARLPNADVVAWMEATIVHLGDDHRRASPDCHPDKLHNIMVPITGADYIGGPAVQ